MDEPRTRNLRRASTVTGVIGVALLVIGGVGLALDGDNSADAGPAVAAGAERRTSAPTTGAPTSTALTTEPTATAPPTTTFAARPRAEAFFAEWANALRAGDAATLLARLHPAVIDRYGDAACRAYLANLRLPAATAQVLAVDPTVGPWSWETDGRSTEIRDALGVQLRRSEDGTTFTEAPAHVAIVDGEVRWFTDCGTPKEA